MHASNVQTQCRAASRDDDGVLGTVWLCAWTPTVLPFLSPAMTHPAKLKRLSFKISHWPRI